MAKGYKAQGIQMPLLQFVAPSQFLTFFAVPKRTISSYEGYQNYPCNITNTYTFDHPDSVRLSLQFITQQALPQLTGLQLFL